jgi:exosortase
MSPTPLNKSRPGKDVPAIGRIGNAPARNRSITGAAPRWISATGVGLAGLIILALILLLFGRSMAGLWRIWDLDPNYSHGPMVVLAAIALAGRARYRGNPLVAAGDNRRGMLAGGLFLFCGLLLHQVAWLLGNPLLDVVSLICVLLGVLFMLGGHTAFCAYGFSVLLLIFMAPLPESWYAPLAVAMQQSVAWVATVVLQTLGVAVLREGYQVHLPQYTMEVGAACSGLRQMTAFLALSAVVAHLSGKAMWFKVSLMVLAVPIAMLANCLRVIVTGLIAHWLEPSWAEGVFHSLEGMATVAIGTALLLGAAALLTRFETRRQSRARAERSLAGHLTASAN